MKNKIRIYVSHSIRGMKGADATKEGMVANNLKAMKFGQFLTKRFPGVKFYVPAEHDEFVLIAYEKGYLNEQEMLAIDCEIVNRCQALIAYVPDQYISNGMLTEILHAQRTGKTVLIVTNDMPGIIVENYLERLKR